MSQLCQTTMPAAVQETWAKQKQLARLKDVIVFSFGMVSCVWLADPEREVRARS